MSDTDVLVLLSVLLAVVVVAVVAVALIRVRSGRLANRKGAAARRAVD